MKRYGRRALKGVLGQGWTWPQASLLYDVYQESRPCGMVGCAASPLGYNDSDHHEQSFGTFGDVDTRELGKNNWSVVLYGGTVDVPLVNRTTPTRCLCLSTSLKVVVSASPEKIVRRSTISEWHGAMQPNQPWTDSLEQAIGNIDDGMGHDDPSRPCEVYSGHHHMPTISATVIACKYMRQHFPRTMSLLVTPAS